jgi:hypothetical protein
LRNCNPPRTKNRSDICPTRRGLMSRPRVPRISGPRIQDSLNLPKVRFRHRGGSFQQVLFLRKYLFKLRGRQQRAKILLRLSVHRRQPGRTERNRKNQKYERPVLTRANRIISRTPLERVCILIGNPLAWRLSKVSCVFGLESAVTQRECG